MTSYMKRKPRQLLNTVTVSLGCSCRRPKLSSIFTPKPKSKLPKYPHHHNPLSYFSSTSTSSSAQTASSFSPFIEHYPSSSGDLENNNAYHDAFGRRVGSKSVAVEKESEDPYLDFRQSMLQMIVENEIYSKDELKELLNCFLQLNEPGLHGVIIRVFTEIWNSFFFGSGATNGIRRHGNRSVRQRVYVKPKSYEI
ncbi:hypothetical protein Droror1_Dr00026355 [Drosera rotundifolia]